MAKKSARTRHASASTPLAVAPAGEPRADMAAELARADGFTNALTGIGTQTYDKRKSTTFAAGTKLTYRQCADLYRYGGLARRVIDLPVNDATRNWFRIKGDDENVVVSRLEELGAQRKIAKAAKIARVFGGGVVVMGLNGGEALDQPVREDAVKSVDYLLVFDPRECVPTGALDLDPKSPSFGEPLLYQVRPVTAGAMQTVHVSRLLRFNGFELPRDEWLSNSYWHDSVYNAAWDHLRQVGAVFDSAEFVVDDFVQHIIRLKGVLQATASKAGEAKLKTRLQMLEQSRSVLSTMLLDSEEEYEKATTQAAGLADILDRFMMSLASVCGIPVTILFGRSPAGLNATGESDTRHYYDTCGAMQRNDLGPELERLVRYILRAEGKSPEEDWSIEWAPIYSPTARETTENYKLTAEADAIYVNAQVAMPEQIEQYRMGGVRFNADPPTWEIAERPEIDPAVVAAMAAAQAAAKSGQQPLPNPDETPGGAAAEAPKVPPPPKG